MSTTSSAIEQTSRAVEKLTPTIDRLVRSVESVIVGQRAMIDGLLIGLLTDGHVLLEGVPGLAKTLTVSTLARCLHASFHRIQFTPDLLPADLIGTLIYNPREATFTPRRGPIFANIILADEINRAPAKVQSALLEAMQERQVTIGDTTYTLDDPFLVLATQNPIEQEGTYPLPEAQVDRFMLKLNISYPTKSDERAVVDRAITNSQSKSASATSGITRKAPEPVLDLNDVRTARHVVSQIHLDDKVRDYIVEIVHASRHPEEHKLDIKKFIEFGASPRGSICLALASKARAFLQGRAYVTPADVKAVAPDVLRHRIVVSYEAQADQITGADIVKRILDTVPVP
jgi:MoxR-like ATPase